MAHDWIKDLIEGVADAMPEVLSHSGDSRPAHRFGLFFAFVALLGALIMIACALPGVRQLPVVGWWLLGLVTAVAASGAGVCFWIASRSEDS